MAKDNGRVEVYSRVCGFFRPVQQFNRGKKEGYKDRKDYNVQAIPAKCRNFLVK